MEKVSIVIPVYNHASMTIDCLNSVLKTCKVSTEIIVVDDGSEEPVSKIISRMFPQVNLFTNQVNRGFAHTVNKGIQNSTNNLVCLLNNDIILPNPMWLKTMVDNLNNFNLDMTAPAGGRMDKKWNYVPGEAKRRGDKFSYLVGWCLLVKKKVFEKIGLMPTDFGRGFWEDVLFSFRAKKAGFKMGISEGTDVKHLYHTTFKSAGIDINKQYNENRKIFLKIIGKR